jgi:threonine/homoserine/homoserine lactone efflux protein
LSAIILKAIVTGFILSIMIGPVFFVLLETSIRKGIRAALSFDLGVLFSDLIYILIAFIFFSEVSNFAKGENEWMLKVFGGVMFLIFGLITFFKTPKEHTENDLGKIVHSTKDYVMLFIKGLLLNMANPMVIFYWFSVMTLGAKNTGEESSMTMMLIYLSTILIVFFSIDVLKIVGAKKLRPFINSKVLKSLSRITGSVLMLFGIVLLVQGILSKM